MFLAALCFLTLEAAADLMQPTLMARIVDRGVQNADLAEILRCGAVMLSIAALGAFGAVMRSLFASRTSQAVAKEIRSDLFRHVQDLSRENIDTLHPASLVTRITSDVTQVQEFVNGMMRIIVKAPITCVGAIVLILIQTPRALPLVAVILIISACVIYANMCFGYPRFGRTQKKLDALNGRSREFLSSVRVVKAFGAEDTEKRKFDAASGELAGAMASAQKVVAVCSPLINLTVNFGIVVMLWLFRSGDPAQLGRPMASVNYMSQMLASLGMVMTIMDRAVRAMTSSARIREVLETVPAQKQTDTPQPMDEPGAVVFEHVTFTYAGGGRPALNDVTFRAAPGETIGIIGPTGSGKSTLAGLVPRFYDAQGGVVRVGGADVTRAGDRALRSRVAMVPQKPLLFSGTIRENLLQGREGATDAELREAARLACADEFIDSSEQGLDTRLGQGGVNLSGGQKQRLSLARALVRGADVLVLDDCTSALDAATEKKVLDGLRASLSGTTVLLVSQRIAAVMRADRILCLENGAVRGFGTHAELMASCPAYRDICRSQIGGDAA